ncbi:MAG: hypothetical protein LBC81_02140 [Tannerellaceae bacterium]|jgi:hypothetical protein|nr:hypothetical protein [Tannerellaceae bacterium]
MSTRKDIFPRKDAQFVPWSDNFIEQAELNAGAWNIPVDYASVGELSAGDPQKPREAAPVETDRAAAIVKTAEQHIRNGGTIVVANLNELKVLHVNFKTAYALTLVPVTSNPVNIAAKKISQKIFVSALRKFIQEYIVHNSRVNDDDLILLGITPYKKTRTPAQKAKSYPVTKKVVNSAPGVLYFHTVDSSGTIPEGTQGQLCFYCVGQNQPAHFEQLNRRVYSQHNYVRLEFPMEELGLTIYYCFCWENTKGEHGDHGPIENRIIG